MRTRPWLPVVAVFLAVLAAQLALVALAGTDVPYQDQWDVEGRRLYPSWMDGSWRAADLWAPHNEHRILWTRGLDLALFAANGTWDPLVQLAANAGIRAAAAALLAWLLARGLGAAGRLAVAAGVTVAFLPHLAWQNALWGFQSQVYFALLFAIAALGALDSESPARRKLGFGIGAGLAAQLAMGAGLLVPLALLGLVALRAVERRGFDRARWGEAWPALVLLAVALALREEATTLDVLRPSTLREGLGALAQALAWPHVWTPLAALGLNLPLALAVVGRLAGRRRAVAGEDFVVLLAGWTVALAAAMAWSRGGGGEFDGGVPSRYADFLVLLPIANAWCAVVLMREAAGRWPRPSRLLAAAWGLLLFAGWLGLSAEVMHRLVLPRIRDREAPVMTVVAFQRTGDASGWSRLPRLYAPHPDPRVVQAVLADPRLHGRLPPSLQPDQPLGPL